MLDTLPSHRRSQHSGEPSATSAAIILWKKDARRGQLVVACNRTARQIGVRVGIAIAQATELAHAVQTKNTGHLPPIVQEHDPVADAVALQRIAAALQRHISPLVAYETLGNRPWAGQVMLACDTLFCELTGVTHLFDDEAGILAQTHRCLAALGFAGKIAIADNAAAAWAHAHYNTATDFLSTHLVDDLAPLPVNALRLEIETKYTLDRLGVETVEALLRLPRSGLARRLGRGIVDRIAEAIGEIEVPLEMHHAEQQHRSSHDLEYPTDDLHIIFDRLNRLTKQVLKSLADTQRGALRVACRLDLSGRPPLQTVIGLFAPTLDQPHLDGLIQSSLESVRIQAPITRVTLEVLQSEPLRTQQPSLFGSESLTVENDTVSNASLARLVDTLSGRLGPQAVLGVRPSDNPLPEKAYRTYSLTDHRTRRALGRKAQDRKALGDQSRRRLPSGQRPPRRRSNPTRSTGRGVDRRADSRPWSTDPSVGFQPPTQTDARRRPLKLLRKPIQLAAVSSTDPARSDTLPAFRFEDRLHRIVYFWGPERIETGWWDGPAIRRNYYRVETETGKIWWIFQDLTSGTWFLQGRFS